MSQGDIHTVPHGWANRAEGSERVSNTAPTKVEAQAVGGDLAKHRRVEHLIHKKDGKIGERNTYKRDPFPPRG